MPGERVQRMAVVGGAFLAVQLVALVGWVASGDASPTPTGDDPVPAYMSVAIRSAEILSVVGFVVFMAIVLVRPWRRNGAITLDGLFCLVFVTLFWQDTTTNYLRPWFTYNAEFVNLGNWDPHIIGWSSSGGNVLAAPLLLHLAYVWGIFGAVILGCGLLRRVRDRWPHLQQWHLIAIAFAWFLLVEGLAEPAMLLSGIASYPGSIAGLTLFHGHYFQFPVYQWLLFSALWTSWACLRFFKDDLGRTWPERGIDGMRMGARTRTATRFLALTGAANTLFLVVYSIPNALFGLGAQPWIDDVRDRSYLGYVCEVSDTSPCDSS